MKGNTVVITGGTSGIGEVAAEMLAKKGARIVLVARDESRGEGIFAISPAQGAETMVYLASSRDVATITGRYYYKFRPTPPSAAARDHRSALLLWQRSAELAGTKENGAPAS